MQISRQKLKELLVGPGFVSEADFKRAEDKAARKQAVLADFLIDQGLIKDEELGRLLAQDNGWRFINLREEKINENILRIVPETVARDKKIIAFAKGEKGIRVGMQGPGDLNMIHILEKRFNADIEPFFITDRDFNLAISQYQADIKSELDLILKKLASESPDSAGQDKLFIKIVDKLLEYACYSRASDIHIEPLRGHILVRFRIDGLMHNIIKLPKKLQETIISRIKILARMRTDEHRAAQDGKFKFNYGKERVDIRVSIIPVTEGENAVMRLLSQAGSQLDLDKLGFSDHDLKKVKEVFKNPHGMILSTGPTGSGKTTTLYEILKILNREEVHIASIEDPVEYDIEGVSQIQVDTKTNLTFAKGLRAIVRQDPDIILVGEIRDEETAKIAINSAMTGHLVLSTLHTNDAATAIPRLLDIGIEPYLLASTINLIIAQRLIRLNCRKCRYSYQISEEEQAIINNNAGLKELIIKKYRPKEIAKIRLYAGAGCKVCAGTGFSGRIGIYEVLEIKPKIRDLMIKKASSEEISAAAEANGMTTIFEDGLDRVFRGDTSLAELLRVSMV